MTVSGTDSVTASRIERLTTALRMGVSGDVVGLKDVFTEDVVGWSPNLSVASRHDLAEAFGERQDSFTDITLDIGATETVGNKVIAEWVVTANHTGPFTVGEDLVIEPTGRQLVLAGATFAEFKGDQIVAFRSYFDDAALLEQMLVSD
jgi:ketosteroid isomerase-like protein